MACDHIQKCTVDQALEHIDNAKVPILGNLPAGEPTIQNLLREGAPLLRSEDFYLLNYDYGDLMIADGVFRAPGRYFTDPSKDEPQYCASCASTARNLEQQYSKESAPAVPLLLILRKSVELFITVEDVLRKPHTSRLTHPNRIVPFRHRKPGELLGIFEGLRPIVNRLDPLGPFYASAGSRNIHLAFPIYGDATNSFLKHIFGKKSTVASELADERKRDIREYKLEDDPQNRGIPSDWRLIRRSGSPQKWRVSTLLLPKAICQAFQSGHSQGAEWLQRFRHRLLLEAWAQTQDALESFVHDDPQTREARRADPGYFFQFDDFSTISIIRYLAGAANGRNLVHTVSVDSTLAPVEEFLSWYFQTGLHDSDDYLPLVLEPHHLEEGEGKRTVGIVSLIHPLIGSVLHWKEREGWGPGKLSREFDRVVEKMGLSGQIHSDLSDGTETRKAIKADIPDMESVFSQAAIALTDVLGRFKVGASARYTPREIKRLLANMGKIVRKDSVLESYVAVKRI